MNAKRFSSSSVLTPLMLMSALPVVDAQINCAASIAFVVTSFKSLLISRKHSIEGASQSRFAIQRGILALDLDRRSRLPLHS